MAAPSLPPGLGLPAESKGEQQMYNCLQANDAAGALAALAAAPEVNARMINMAITAKIQTGTSVDTAAVEMLKACEEAGIVPTAAMHNNVLAFLSKRGPPEAVLSWIARMQASNIALDRVACNIQLKAHAAAGDLNASVKLLSSMMRAAVSGPPTPDAISFNTVISALADTDGYAEKAVKLLTTMLDSGYEPDQRSFTGVILAFARASRARDAAKWLERMFERGVQPDATTFNTVLLAYSNAADCDGAFALLEAAEARARDECPNARPDAVSYNTLISACAKAGRPAEAERAFFRMEQAKFAPTQVSFTSVLSAHARAGAPAQAQAWLDAMVSRGLTPDAMSFNSLVAAHARVGDAAAALACFERMNAAGVAATSTTRAILVNALVQAGRADEAEAMLSGLVAGGEHLSASSFNPLLHLHAKSGRPERALAILRLMESAQVTPSLITFNSLANAYAAVGDLGATEDALSQAKELGYTLDKYSFGALLQAATRAASKGGAAKRDAARKSALKHTEAMLASSSIEVNDFLASAATRAVGAATYAQLKEKHAVAHATASFRWQRAEVEVPAPTEAPAADGVRPASSADDGWTTVEAPRASKRRGRFSKDPKNASPQPTRASAVSKAKSPIGKERPAQAPKKESLTSSGSAGDVRLVGGVPLTRSKSERARLLALAQDVAGATGGGITRTASQDLLLKNPVPLTRSAASELALTLGSDMIIG